MFSLIDRWLLKEVAKTLLVILVVLLTMMVAVIMVRLLGQVAAGSVGGGVLLMLVGLEVLKLLGSLIPPAFFFSILWVLGRLYRDGEMLAMHAAGIGTARIYRAFMFSAVPLALLVAWLSLAVLPWAKLEGQQVRLVDSERSELDAIRPGEFSEFSRGKLVMFAERKGLNGGLRGLFVQDRMQETPGVVTASEIKQLVSPENGGRYVVLVNGHRYQGMQGGGPMSVGEFAEYGFLLPTARAAPGDLPASARDWRELLSSTDPVLRAELQDRLVAPLAVLAFTLIAVPLARSTPRQGIYGRLGLAILIYLIFMNLQHLGEQWMGRGVTPSWLGTWWVPASLAAAAGLVLWFDSPRWRVWLRRRTVMA